MSISPKPVDYRADMNPVVNGNMTVHQRVNAITLSSGVDTYTLDQWRCLHTATTPAAITVNQFGQNLNTPDFLPEYAAGKYLRWAQTTTGAGATQQRILHLIEDPRLFAGLPVTLSFWARSDTATTLGVQVSQFVTAGGTAGPLVNVTLTPTWKKYSYTTTLGNTITAVATNSALVLSFFPPMNLIQNTDLMLVQLDRGYSAQPFKYETFETTYRRCLRYYQKSFPYATAPAQNAGVAGGLRAMTVLAGAATCYMYQPLPVTMRATPTVTFYNPGAANALARNTLQSIDSASTASGGPASEHGIAVDVVGVATPTSWNAGAAVVVHWTASAEL